MKSFHVPMSHLTPTLIQEINQKEEGVYFIYGAFIYEESLMINKLHKGKFSDIEFEESSESYLVPVPEFVVNEHDPEYAKYIQLHFIRQDDVKSDEEMMQEFVKAFAAKLAGVSEEETAEQESENA